MVRRQAYGWTQSVSLPEPLLPAAEPADCLVACFSVSVDLKGLGLGRKGFPHPEGGQH